MNTSSTPQTPKTRWTTLSVLLFSVGSNLAAELLADEIHPALEVLLQQGLHALTYLVRWFGA